MSSLERFNWHVIPAKSRHPGGGPLSRRRPVIPAKAGIHANCNWLNLRTFCSSVATVSARTVQPCVYILASAPNGILYVGVTSNLAKRMTEHDQGLIEGFTKRYRIKTLVYYEMHATIPEAIRREKQLKEWRRDWKVRLLQGMNPEWRNLFNSETGEIAFGPADVDRERS